MRVLMLAPEPVYSPRGTPISVINRCRALTALGHEVDLVTYPVGEDVPMPGLRFIRTPRLPGVRRVRIGPSAVKAVLDVLLLVVAARQVVTTRYDVLHTHEEAGVLAWPLRALFGLPHLHDVHCSIADVLRDYGFGPRHPLQLLVRWLERRALAGVRSLIVVFPELVAAMREQAPGIPVHLIYNTPLDEAVDPALSRRLRARWGEGRPVVVYAGTFEPYQGLPLLLQAAQPLRRALPEVRLVLLGGRADQVAEMGRLAARLGVSDCVLLEGLRPAAEVPSYLAAADALVSPRVQGINTPLKIYGYLRAAKPIVATRTTSHLQILDDRCALLVDLDAEAMARGLAAVLSDPALADRLSRGAARRAQDFGVARFLREAAAAYQDVGASAPSEGALARAATLLDGELTCAVSPAT